MKQFKGIRPMIGVLAALIAPVAVSGSTVIATKIVAILPRPDGLYFNIDRMASESGCSSTTLVVRVDTGISELAYKTLAQSISLAYAMEKSVHVYLDGCVGIYPRAYALDIY